MKTLACIFGRHRWTTQTEQGEEYKVCSACRKMKIPKNPGGRSERSYGHGSDRQGGATPREGMQRM